MIIILTMTVAELIDKLAALPPRTLTYDIGACMTTHLYVAPALGDLIIDDEQTLVLLPNED